MTEGIDREHESEVLRTELSPEQRAADMRLAIDPGFVHHSRIESLARIVQEAAGECGDRVCGEFG
jgi:hypothetical protein